MPPGLLSFVTRNFPFVSYNYDTAVRNGTPILKNKVASYMTPRGFMRISAKKQFESH